MDDQLEYIRRMEQRLFIAETKVRAMRELQDATENLIIAIGMGWDLDGVIEEAKKYVNL